MLFQYRITPQTTTGVSPAELMLGRRLHSRLDCLKPKLDKHVEKNQSRQKQFYDAQSRDHDMGKGDSVYVKYFTPGAKPKWQLGTVLEKTGAVSCEVELEGGVCCKRHFDHVHSCQEETKNM